MLTQTMNAHLAKIARPARGLLFVRPVTTDETMPGGKVVLLEETRGKWTGQQVEVIAVGAPEKCKDEDCERSHGTEMWQNEMIEMPSGKHLYYHWLDKRVQPGAWIVVRPRSTAELDPWSDLRVVRQADVLGVFSERSETR